MIDKIIQFLEQFSNTKNKSNLENNIIEKVKEVETTTKEISKEDSKKISEHFDEEIFKHYKKKLLFTKSEYAFMKEFLKYSKDKDLFIMSKVRIADFVKISGKMEFGERNGLFNRIKSKHIDFVILDTTLKIKCLIEVDGRSHKTNQKTIKSDEFKNILMDTLGLELIRFNTGDYNFSKLDKLIV